MLHNYNKHFFWSLQASYKSISMYVLFLKINRAKMSSSLLSSIFEEVVVILAPPPPYSSSSPRCRNNFNSTPHFKASYLLHIFL